MLRCKSGDLAIVIKDTFQSINNIGRIVSVRGPTRYEKFYNLICWQIKPITKEKYWIETRSNDIALPEKVYWNSPVYHPDSWLLPIRPEDKDFDISDAEEILKNYFNLNSKVFCKTC